MAGKEQHFSVSIDQFPEGEKSFIDIPFTVGPQVERIEVTYSFSSGSVIDLGLAYNGRMRGWSGSERGHITMAADIATPGYDAGLLPGPWDVVLGIVKIGEAARVDVTVRLIERFGRWFVGDIHSHTEHSDGGVTVLDAIYRARGSGLDFVALTDHNTISQNFLRPDDPSILVLPGMELTTYYGHTNLLGVHRPVADWRCRTPADVAEKMAEARANGATIVINHPFQRSAGGKWQSGHDLAFDAVEIWNGNWSPLNLDALAWWQDRLRAGHICPVTGGSDFHLKNRRRHGRPANRVFADSHSIADILAGIRAGRNQVCFAPDSTVADRLDDSLPLFGDRVAAGAPIGLVFSGLAASDEVRTVTEAGVVASQCSQNGRLVVQQPYSGQFLRYEVWNGDNPRLFTNPFYAE